MPSSFSREDQVNKKKLQQAYPYTPPRQRQQQVIVMLQEQAHQATKEATKAAPRKALVIR
ncbi:hypothetical protein CGMCC3_g7729 [Colletotrichum fructicola]|nr:uncharacterized protein CGMCC3_g7729 [Colletotrichum fructicola]KAE9576220.1 hypothetical protein CGMCC3_g7729 [Colletotrichum fructicola]